MLLTNNYNNAFEFVKVIIQNIVNPDTGENGIFDDVTITSVLRSDVLLCGESFLMFY